ncbi:J domain-containing protein [Ramlibacter sp.]|uniref:J domain-containing protein n=1 Tax=Ramlibacter sp. TaxID=1917967 RepID=UPI002D58D50D|nr:DnaJ domain-containing protein [Ramlibacter sp.]HYD77980.1 DnaJ domain-containing protein [Ramlibacter sp.]
MSAKGPASLYDVLGLSPAASAQDVRQAWRRLAQQHHPDRSDTADSEAMALINQAYEVLSDADRRARYDFGRTRSTEPRQPGRVRLPADRTKARLAWGAAIAVATAFAAAWALVGRSDRTASPAEAAVAPDVPARPARPASPRAVPQQAAGPVDTEPPLRLIPATRIEARRVAPDAGPAQGQATARLP